MIQLARRLLRDWQVWLLVMSPAFLLIVVTIATVMFNMNDTQKRLDASNERLIEYFKNEILELRTEIHKGAIEREQLHKTIEPLKELSKKLETPKD